MPPEFRGERCATASSGISMTCANLMALRKTLGFGGVGDALVASIQGHSTGNVQDTHYGESMRREAAALRPFIERLHYPGLTLRCVYVTPKWSGFP